MWTDFKYCETFCENNSRSEIRSHPNDDHAIQTTSSDKPKPLPPGWDIECLNKFKYIIMCFYILDGKREDILMAAPTMLIIILEPLLGRDQEHSHQDGKEEGITEDVPII